MCVYVCLQSYHTAQQVCALSFNYYTFQQVCALSLTILLGKTGPQFYHTAHQDCVLGLVLPYCSLRPCPHSYHTTQQEGVFSHTAQQSQVTILLSRTMFSVLPYCLAVSSVSSYHTAQQDCALSLNYYTAPQDCAFGLTILLSKTVCSILPYCSARLCPQYQVTILLSKTVPSVLNTILLSKTEHSYSARWRSVSNVQP